MDFQFLNLSNSSNSDISEDEFYNVRQGEYTRFDSFDDDIEIIKSDVFSNDKSVNSGQYFQYDNIDDIIVNTETNNLVNSKTDKTNVNQNISPELDFEYDEIVKEINELQISNPTIPQVVITPAVGFRKRLQKRMSDDFSKFVKRPSFLYKLKSERYTGIFRRESVNLIRASSVPKIVIVSPKSRGQETDSGNDSDRSDDVNIFKKQVDRLEKRSSNQKLYVSSKKKAMRKSI